jgi:hypothetical protein
MLNEHMDQISNKNEETNMRSLTLRTISQTLRFYRGADKSLARPGGKQATATEDFDFRISYL